MVSVERAVAEDASLFATLEQAPDTKEYILPYSHNEHAQKMVDPSVVYLRILDGVELAGFLILALDSDSESIEFRRIVVSAKGRGVGQLAIAAMEQFCLKELHRTRVWLDVFEHNRRGRHLYEKLGYEKYGKFNHEGRTLVLYQKKL
jgi:ribosomal protein S18 acetylase RimI-like enzyme